MMKGLGFGRIEMWIESMVKLEGRAMSKQVKEEFGY